MVAHILLYCFGVLLSIQFDIPFIMKTTEKMKPLLEGLVMTSILVVYKLFPWLCGHIRMQDQNLNSEEEVREDVLIQEHKNSTIVILKTELWTFPLHCSTQFEEGVLMSKMYVCIHICDYLSGMLFPEKLNYFQQVLMRSMNLKTN